MPDLNLESSRTRQAPLGDVEPTRELFTQEQLLAHARLIAAQYPFSAGVRRGRPLLARLDASATRLDEAYRRFVSAAQSDPHAVASEDWLRDNYHVVQDQVREIRQDLPRQFYRELPKVEGGGFDGFPRIYLLAFELVAHSAGRFDLEILIDFAGAYQDVAPLSIGETWAIPIMLRLALVEELQRLADGVLAARVNRQQARDWVSRTASAAGAADDLDELLRGEVRTEGRLSPALVVELLQWLRDQPSSAAPVWQTLERRLREQDDSPEEMLRIEQQREAAEQLAIGNVITSMRLVSAVDWAGFFERVSLVEQVLRGDPAAAYAAMDFSTRDRYRHSVEQLSRRAKRPELEIARRAVQLARDASTDEPQLDRRHHVGYYLISRGRFALEQDLGYHPTVRQRLARFAFRHPALGYLGALSTVITLTLLSLVAYAGRRGATDPELWLVAVLCLLPVSELAVNLVNRIITSQVPPRPLPKLSMREGIPRHDRTMVVVPVIVESVARVKALFDDLEVRFLANRDPHLHFALLSDFADSHLQSEPDDPSLIDEAKRRVADLNARYGADRFFFFHRQRRWNPREGCWMGWERKRGKLTEFNDLLRGNQDTSFVTSVGDLSILAAVKYVITLDSDTQLPLDEGRRLVGTLSHPLNRPRFDARLQRVTEGYGVLQPRVTVSVVSATRTTFARVLSGHVGLDPYTTAVSDVYQDLFHEGSYVGKGIYDVDAFRAALAGRVPENALLSHDLFEGFYARVGLCTDVQVVDDYPGHYLAFAGRQHRWVRGDWQIIRWLWRTVRDTEGHRVANTLPVMARWKILDNLRRSLLPPSLVLLFVAGWTLLPGSPGLWTTLALLVLAFPAYVQVARSLSTRAKGVPLREHLRAERHSVVLSAQQVLLSTTFLAHQAWLMLDAILRTLVRLLVTRRPMLEWVSAERLAQSSADYGAIVRRMWAAPAGALLIGALVIAIAPARAILAAPVLILWFASPLLASVTAQPQAHRRASLTATQRSSLRQIARKTWRFFDELVGPADHWLVPDNYQEDRADVLAHRTSPTNIGLQLLSTVAAHDFGYLTFGGVLDRMEGTMGTLLRMQRYRGHFYNWYDTQTLAPLMPAYISTVDSGNLAGYLVALKSGLLEAIDSAPVIGTSFLSGLDDVIALAEKAVEQAVARHSARRVETRALRDEFEMLRAQLRTDAVPLTVSLWQALLQRLADHVATVGVRLHEIEDLLVEEPEADVSGVHIAEALEWLDQAGVALTNRRADLDRLVPWASTLGGVDPGAELPATVPTLASLTAWCTRTLAALEGRADPAIRSAIEQSRVRATELIERAERLAVFADDLVEEMEFGFLFDRQRQLFSIGFNVGEGRLDASYYDTLASEARLASFLTIAVGQIPHEHWFKLARSLAPSNGSRALLSWSASMFEYLMPLLVMRTYPGTLLDETYEAVVDRHIAYGVDRGVPWGISESAYNAQDLERNYQYRAFGVPGLGLKRGLAEDLVIAPYATMLAAPLRPRDALDNLERLSAEGLEGRYGYYEAIDYTPERMPPGHTGGVVLRTYMAHHQGMALVALDNCLNDVPMSNRFHADARVQAAELLLQERVPDLVALHNPPIETVTHVPSARRTLSPTTRRYVTPHTLSPRAHLLSNGSYTVMITNAGGGYSRWQHLALTRWREDITTDSWGTFCYVRDLSTREVWSTTHQPIGREADEHEVTFAPDRAVFRRRDGDIEVHTEVTVSPEDDAELRRVSLTNHGDRPRDLELTSYAEVVLAPGEADLAHPAFSKLFIETSVTADGDALICRRRPRGDEPPAYLVHVLSGRGRMMAATEHETDRARFIGRGGTARRPSALFGDGALSNTTGAVLDPIVSLRQRVRLPPRGTARVSFTTGFAPSEEAARQLVEKYHDRRAVARALALASTHSQIELRHLGLSVEDTVRFQRLAGRLLYGDPRLRVGDALIRNGQAVQELWKFGISGDLPILTVRLSTGAEIPLFRELLKAHEYLRLKGFSFDLVVLNGYAVGYRQELHDELQRLVAGTPEQAWLDRPGGVFLRKADLMAPGDQTLLVAAARAVMNGAEGSLREQLALTLVPFEPEPPLESHVNEPKPPGSAEGFFRALQRGFPRVVRRASPTASDVGRQDAATVTDHQRQSSPSSRELRFFNGLGGFSNDGREYVISVHQKNSRMTPAPWSNVIAQPHFGCTATESGPGFTWSGNSHHNRLTPWRNDPVGDEPGEALFVRDDESGTFWSATPLPAGGGELYTVRHGQGYTAYDHRRDDLKTELLLFVARDQPVKIFRLRLQNDSARRRRCSVTMYVEWVLGEHRSRSGLHVVTEHDAATGAVFARNAFRPQFGGRIAFLDLHGGDARSVTGDRNEFIGRNGSLTQPAALERESLSDRTGATLDPCGAVQVTVELAPGEAREFVALLGETEDIDRARALITQYRVPAAVESALHDVRGSWDHVLATLDVHTPDAAFDLMINRWLLYQTLSCRIWGRSAFYQSSGAFGFRDQLQDVLALLFAAPDLVRDHILHAASRQFVEGDVQHWWHEPGGEGVRTRCSDDRLWLAYATLSYIQATGDDAILDEQVGFLDGRTLKSGEDEAYERPTISAQVASLYEHCVKAIHISLATGTHGLPLVGSGDWNDGMNRIGREGRGESVWLGWFLASILRPFADLADRRGDPEQATSYRAHADRLAKALDEAWDGAWYRRAYFDDGTPLGSAANSECQIDAIAQSWAAISGEGEPARVRQALQSTLDRLVMREDALLLLLAPPFDHFAPNPGYIKGYLPGVRENGGQYTHAALWTVLAFARLRDGDRAMDLFSLLNPVNHARTPPEVARYRAEPYVVAADVYSVPPHTGRGGWTWYTGSAGWMYRVGIEAILGITLERNAIRLDPCIPRSWPGFEATFRRDDVELRIVVENPDGVSSGVRRIEVDGVTHEGAIDLVSAPGVHHVRVRMGAPTSRRDA